MLRAKVNNKPAVFLNSYRLDRITVNKQRIANQNIKPYVRNKPLIRTDLKPPIEQYQNIEENLKQFQKNQNKKDCFYLFVLSFLLMFVLSL